MKDKKMRSYLRETIDGFIFWSFFHALAPMIWFYPLNELELSGYEAFAGCWFFPIICGVPHVLHLLQKKWIIICLKLLTVLCLASFQMPTTLIRLIVLAAGAGVSMIVFTTSLSHPNVNVRQSFFRSLIFGMFALLASRIWFVTFIPTWWSNTSNSVVIALGIVSAFDLITTEDLQAAIKIPSQVVHPNWFLVSVGIGSLLFTTHWCFGEVSVISRWVVQGYPAQGPSPVPWGAPVLVALLLGLFLSDCARITSSYLWWLIGAASLAAVYKLPAWYGYAGGVILAVYVMSIWPKMICSYTKCPPAKSTCVIMATYIAEVLYSVWTVAFNFVPGGTYTRERTGVLIIIIFICVFLGLKSDKNTFDLSGLIGLTNKKSFQAWLLIIVIFGAFGIGYRSSLISEKLSADPTPTKQFSSAIWTYHFGYDNEGWPSLERSAKVLNETGADVITLLESDASKTFLGNNDLGVWLGERLGMYVDFGPATRDHTWGNLILSKYPIIKSVHHLLPSPHGELAPGITATINISGEAVDFVVVHMGNDRDVVDRKLQAIFLAKELRSSKNPVVFMGYVTSEPGSRDYKHLIDSGNVKDIDHSDRDRWCEYILYRGLIRQGYARITHGGLSDTEIQLAKFQIPEDKQNFKDNSKMTINPNIPSKNVLFNPAFGSHYPVHMYTQQHHYHMNTPKYFLP